MRRWRKAVTSSFYFLDLKSNFCYGEITFMKYLIFGRRGWLAQKFSDFLEDFYISPIDVTNLSAVRRELGEKKPEVVINTAGKTGRPNIDWCEEHDTETIISNIIGARKIQIVCSERGIYWVHLSSGCIFQGEGPNGKGFKEHDEASPPSWYSYTKYWTDHFLKDKSLLIVRLRLPIDTVPGPRNFIDKVKKYSKVINDENSVTVIPDFLEAVKKLIEKRRTGIYHIVNPGTISPSKIMEVYKEIVDPNHQFEVITDQDLYKQGLATAQRSNCVLNTDKLQKEGIKLKPIQERIIEVMKEYKKNL